MYAVGDKVSFLCSGRGRGGHVRVVAEVVKVNRKTANVIETKQSYKPGMVWNVAIENLRKAV